MQMDPECVPCLLNRVLFETELSAPEKREQTMCESLKILSERFTPGVNSARLATEVHRRAYDILGDDDPYLELKKRSDEVAESLIPRAKEMIDSSEDRLRATVLCSIAGNVLDFGIGTGFDDPDSLIDAFDSLVSEGLNVDDLPKLRSQLREVQRILFLLDNCGEAVFDRLLIEELRKFDLDIVGVVKGEPILTDVTMDDGRRSSIVSKFDRVLSTGSFAVGVDVEHAGEDLRAEMEQTDLILSKGMANFESLSDLDYRPICYIMRAKCHPVANAIGASKGDNVVRVYE